MLSRLVYSSSRSFSSCLKPTYLKTSFHLLNKKKAIFQNFDKTNLRLLSQNYENTHNNINNKSLALISMGLAGVAALFTYGISQSVNNKTNSWSPELRKYLKTSYLYVLGGITTASSTCFYFLKNHPEFLIKPYFAFGSFIASIGLIFLTKSISYNENFALKNASFLALCGLIGISFIPAAHILGRQVLARAAMMTSGVVAGMSLAGICAPDEQFLWLGGPLFMGLLAVVGIQFATILFPARMARVYNFSLYPTIGLFAVMLLYDTQHMINLGKLSVTGRVPYDPVDGAMKMFITITNLFSSFLAKSERKR